MLDIIATSSYSYHCRVWMFRGSGTRKLGCKLNSLPVYNLTKKHPNKTTVAITTRDAWSVAHATYTIGRLCEWESYVIIYVLFVIMGIDHEPQTF